MRSVRAGDGLKQRLEPLHVLADARIEVAEPDVARRYSLRANLFREFDILACRGDRVVEDLEHGSWRLRRSQEAVPGRVLIIDPRCERGGDCDRLADRLLRRPR